VRPWAVTCPVALDPASLLRWTSVLPRVPQLRTPPPCWGELQRWHVPLDFGPCFLASEGSGAATCLMAPDSASTRRELRCCHVSHDSQWTVLHKNKERLSCPRHVARLAYSQGTLMCYRGACKMCRHAALS
jgi:hypothetical protein